jgi:hypothetical protein
MIKINYDITLEKGADNRVSIYPTLDPHYVTQKGQARHNFLCVPNNGDSPWEWLGSDILVASLKDKYQQLRSYPKLKEGALTIRQVVNDQLLINDDFYVNYVKGLFSSIRCGLGRDEMCIKLLGRFSGAEWSELNFILGGIIAPHTPEYPLLRCKIEPLYATVQSVLPPYEVKRKKKWDVKDWKPKDSMDYQIVWHLMVTLSNGEKHKMYYPICSLNKWHNTIKQYFIENPNSVLSPDTICGVTYYSDGYSYENIMEDLKFLEDLVVGVFPSEILIKLSAFFNYSDRAAHLQKKLTGNEAELIFSDVVRWI